MQVPAWPAEPGGRPRGSNPRCIFGESGGAAFCGAAGGGNFDWKEFLALSSNPAQLVAHMRMGKLEVGMKFDMQLTGWPADLDAGCAPMASSNTSSTTCSVTCSGGGANAALDTACRGVGAAAEPAAEAEHAKYTCIPSLEGLSLQMDSMELDLLLGEQLAPPTQADLQQRALLQLLQPGADAGGAACAVQLAASLTAGMPQMYLHKLEPHPLAGMAADDEAPSREDSGAGPAQQAEYDGRPQCRRQGKQPSGGQQGPGDAPAARRKRPRTLQTPQAQQEQAHAPEAGSSGSGSSGEHSESGQPEQLNQMEHDAVANPVAQMPAASPVGPGRRYAKETLTLEVLEREGLLDQTADDAAHRLGMGKATFKAAGLRLGIERWPYRIRSSARTFLLRLEEFCSWYMPPEEVAAVLRCARSRLAPYLNAVTDTNMEPKLYALRQRCYKLPNQVNDVSEKRMRRDVLRLALDIVEDASVGWTSEFDEGADTQGGGLADPAAAAEAVRRRLSAACASSSASTGGPSSCPSPNRDP